MKSEFMLALTQLSTEKNLSPEVILRAVEEALASAFKKDESSDQSIRAHMSPQSGKVRVYAQKAIVDKVTCSQTEIEFSKAKEINPEVKIGDAIEVEITPQNVGRITASVARQVILQRLREAERDAVFAEYKSKEKSIISGMVGRREQEQIQIDLGNVVAILPSTEQIPTEKYRPGQRLKALLLEVHQGSPLVVSRAHSDFLGRLLQLEVPEVNNGTVIVKDIVREAGYRSKVAVFTSEPNVDPIGCCIGPRGNRIRNIQKELSGEKLDVVEWSEGPEAFIANSLSPAKVEQVILSPRQNLATVIVPDDQLSLAIGKEGQNVRLVAELTGWKIDIKNHSEMEALEAEEERITPETSAVTEIPERAAEEEEAEEGIEEEEVKEGIVVEAPPSEEVKIRFAEDILTRVGATKEKKPKKDSKAKKRIFTEDEPEE
jgi:N utilization substance protein A